MTAACYYGFEPRTGAACRAGGRLALVDCRNPHPALRATFSQGEKGFLVDLVSVAPLLDRCAGRFADPISIGTEPSAEALSALRAVAALFAQRTRSPRDRRRLRR